MNMGANDFDMEKVILEKRQNLERIFSAEPRFKNALYSSLMRRYVLREVRAVLPSEFDDLPENRYEYFMADGASKRHSVTKFSNGCEWHIGADSISIRFNDESIGFELDVPCFEVKERECAITFCGQEKPHWKDCEWLEVHIGESTQGENCDSITPISTNHIRGLWLECDVIGQLIQLHKELSTGHPEPGLPLVIVK